MSAHRIAVLGAGAWGTALALHMARCGHQVALWAHRAGHAEAMTRDGENRRYLPGHSFPDNLTVTATLEEAVAEADGVLIAVPSHAFAELVAQLAALPRPEHLAWATKGFDLPSGRMLHEVVAEALDSPPCAVISGPTFAEEVAAGLPTAMVSASEDAEEAQWWAKVLHHHLFRVYTQDDVIGVEVGGACKNVMAIAAGVSDGLGMGANARAALISRALAEMMRLGVALGARADTFMGLTGVGDLVLTCTDGKSRNRRFGLQLARGEAGEVGGVVEGMRAAEAVHRKARAHGLELPIAEQVYAVIRGERTPQEAVTCLFERDLKAERLV